MYQFHAKEFDMESLLSLFNSTGFMPHGMCFQWRKDILYTHVAADIATGLAYYGVAVGLIYFFMKRDDIPYKKFVIPFGILIFTACGTSHFFSIWTIWNPDFGPEAIIKATTGIVSVATTAILWYLMPHIIALPSPKLLKLKNQELEAEITLRKNAEVTIHKLNNTLEQKIKDRSKQLTYQSSHDVLTGLINRHEFERQTELLVSTLEHTSNEHALCYIDLDQFKVINDTCGHIAGDEMLRQISTVIRSSIRGRDTLARLGGDEFAILMENTSPENAFQTATKIKEAIQLHLFIWENHNYKTSVSIGLVPIKNATISFTELLSAADIACYTAKEKGRNRIQLHEDEESNKHHGEMLWVTQIHQALENNQFCLYAQEISPLVGTNDCHYELLIRMVNEEGNLIPPNDFLPAAERYYLMQKIDRWVIETSLNLLEKSPQFLQDIGFISINLSGQSLAEIDFQNFVIDRLTTSKIPAGKICFEITETAAISNLKVAIEFITTLKKFGCRFALDDFGSGLSSFSYLKNLPVDYLKIDGMFVKDIIDDPIDLAMVKSIHEIGQVMGIHTIAEFVENDEIKGMLKAIGVNYVQGYGIHKPQPLNELIDSPKK